MTRTLDNLEAFTLGYAEAMLWANTDGTEDDDRPADAGPYLWHSPSPRWQLEAFDDDSRASIESDCRDFFAANLRDIIAYARRLDYSTAGYDFALTRNGHGAGYWDRGLGELGDRLTDAAKAYGESTAWADMRDDTTDNLAHLDGV